MFPHPFTPKIAGLGLVTPLGAELDVVWRRLEAGDVAEPKPLSNPETGRVHHAIPVPPKLVEHLGRNPRLRRSSAISYFAVSAGLAALKDAGLELTPETMAKTAVVFSVSDGGVVYTRKLYEQIVKQGANAASPLLFPETVYNAPASHLASQLGIDGMSYTLVGDASAALSAVNFATELLAIGEAEHVLVVAAEELDWILCDAYADWRLARTPLAEGAAAVVLSASGRWSIQTGAGVPFLNQRGAADALKGSLMGLELSNLDLMVSPENGTFIDRALRANEAAWEQSSPRVLTPKKQLGEMIGAGGLVQLVIGALGLEKLSLNKALVPVIGFNHQADAAVVSRG